MRLLFLLSLCLLAACGRQQSFDEKYEEQSKHISTKADSIEREVTQQMTGMAEAERVAAEAKSRALAPPGSAASPTSP